MKRAKIALAFAFTISLFTSLQPANAQLLDAVTDILDVTTGVAGAAVGATLNTAEAITGLPVGVTRDQMLISIDTRQSDFDRYIAEGLASGRLTTAQAAELRGDLDRIAVMESGYRTAGISDANVVLVARELDTFGTRLGNMIVIEPAYKPLLVATLVQPVVITTTVIPYPPIMSDLPIRRRNLEAKIDDAGAVGALSSGEHAELKTALGAVVGAEASFAADGRIDNYEARKLYKAMDRIGSDYDWYVDDGGVTFLGIQVRDDLSLF